jgi:hypothetical protein
MSTTAEITCTIQNDRQSITFRVSDQGEGNSTPNLRGMLSEVQDAITDFQKKPPARLLSNSEAVVQDVSHPTPATQSPQAKSIPSNKGKGFYQKSVQQQNDNPEKDSPGSITEKQIGKIRVNLKFRNIPEKDFCSTHGVACINDLSLNHAHSIIKNEDY